MIDTRAVIHAGAQLDEGVEIGPFAIIGAHVRLGRGTTVGSHAVVDGHTTLGAGCRIFPFASVGMVPQDLKYRGEPTVLEIGDRTVVREFATVNIGTQGGGGVTRVGSDCLLMAYSHVAHDCLLGNRVILANAATLAGHVTVEDFAGIGGLTAVHQFVRIGEHAYVGGCSAIVMDVPPYCTASGNRARLFGLNLEGLKRRGFAKETLEALRRTYRGLFQSKETMARCLEWARAGDDYADPQVRRFVDFIAQSERGVTR
ncbi:MAG: acyl-ACP--UDP-N-acetylglucosamine O-acyltransferase [Deferrisomatales bacterium]|nr:acyl-ACP--UDP-N-acetylglucosamine O-acyltransferase [Deferrisomatales bacterium]